MNPMNVLRMAAGDGLAQLKRVLLVGCEPATLGRRRRADGLERTGGSGGGWRGQDG